MFVPTLSPSSMAPAGTFGQGTAGQEGWWLPQFTLPFPSPADLSHVALQLSLRLGEAFPTWAEAPEVKMRRESKCATLGC